MKYGLVFAIFLLFQTAVHSQSHIKYLAHSGYAGTDLAKFDRTAYNDSRRLARLGDITAQFNLGVINHYRGEMKRAEYWYRRAALFRHPQAAYNLGLMYYRGDGVDQSFEDAFRWMQTAAEADFPRGQLQLGIMYYRGEGTAKDPAQEAYWYREAAEAGDPEAQFNLSVLHSMGSGVEHDPVAAYAWMRLAHINGLDATQELRILEGVLPPNQLALAEQKVAEISKTTKALQNKESVVSR